MSYASALRGGRYALTFWKGCRVRSLRFMGASDDRILECVLCVLSLGRLAMRLVGGVRVERSPYRWSAYNLPLRIVCVRKHFLVDDTIHERAETHIFFRDTHTSDTSRLLTRKRTCTATHCARARQPAVQRIPSPYAPLPPRPRDACGCCGRRGLILCAMLPTRSRAASAALRRAPASRCARRGSSESSWSDE